MILIRKILFVLALPVFLGVLSGYWPVTAESVTSNDKLDHWAFKAPVRPSVPKVNKLDWIQNEIDRFVLSRLEQDNLAPSPEAEKVVLLRRLSLDLIGLPPTLEEVDRFLADSSAGAYDQVVERLLRSPHYGERWGRQWLDAARYADSDGYEKDKSRSVWFYRDWVINALNNDMAYDRFIIEQIAGDLLPNAGQDQRVATGFLRNSMINEEGGVDPEQFRMDAMYDRMDCIGKSVLGLTIQCGQCHDHKYDPMSQKDYYKIFAFINSGHEAQPVVYTSAEQKRVSHIRDQIRKLEEQLRQANPEWESEMALWEDSVVAGRPDWTVVRSVQVSEANTRFFQQKDGSLLGLGYAPTKFTFSFQGTNDLSAIRAFRLELLPDPNLPANGPGRSFKGTCALTEFKVDAADLGNPTNKVSVKIVKATADYANEERDLEPNFNDKSGRARITGPIEFAIDDKDETAWGIDAGPGRRNQVRNAVFVASTNIAFRGGTVLTFHLKNNHGGWNSDDHQNNNIGRFRLSVTGSKNAQADPLPRRVRDVLQIPRDRRSEKQIEEVFSYWRNSVPRFRETNEQIELLWGQFPEGATALTIIARAEPRKTHVLTRGDWLKREDRVSPGVPSFLHPLPETETPTRLTFAKWLVDGKSPTTARVLVNRIWQAYFGTGIVSTPEDFGTQSEKPSHQDLLDWLACEFMDNGWSLKHLHGLIVRSATYRQSSKITSDLYELDPYNRLLARGSRIRVDAEVVRDIALAASGLLNTKVGGPSIYSPAPKFLFLPPASYAPFTWNEESGPERYRRAIYTFRRRSTPYPMLQTFDAPNGDFSCVRRLRSNTPLQALMTLNETLAMECGRSLAMMALRNAGKADSERIRYAFRRTLAREPRDAETHELSALLDRAKRHIADGWVSAAELATGENKVISELPRGVTPTEVAAFTVVSRALLNLDETITRE